MSATYTDNQVLSGSWARVWIAGELLAECTGITARITETRQDVQQGVDIGTKLVGMKGEGTITLNHVYTTKMDMIKEKIKGKDPRFLIQAGIADPDAVDGVVEKWNFHNCAFTETQLFDWKNGELAKKEIPFVFPPSQVNVVSSIVSK